MIPTIEEIDAAEKELLAAEQAHDQKRELFISAEDGFNFALRTYMQKLIRANALARAFLQEPNNQGPSTGI